jgi:hypothetical protein
MHVVSIGMVEDRIVQHVLNQISDNCSIYLLQFLKVLKHALAWGERDSLLRLEAE